MVNPLYNFVAHGEEDFYSRRTDRQVGWRTNEYAIDENGMDEVDAAGLRIASTSTCKIVPGEYQKPYFYYNEKNNITPTVFSWLPGKPWQLPLKADRIEGYSYPASGHAVLVAVSDPRLKKTWHKWPLLNRLAAADKLPVAQWLAVYTAPGKQRAILHLPFYGKVAALQLCRMGITRRSSIVTPMGIRICNFTNGKFPAPGSVSYARHYRNYEEQTEINPTRVVGIRPGNGCRARTRLLVDATLDHAASSTYCSAGKRFIDKGWWLSVANQCRMWRIDGREYRKCGFSIHR